MWPSSLARPTSQQEKRSSRPPQWAASRKPSRTRTATLRAAKRSRSSAKRGDPDAAADQDRAGGSGGEVARLREVVAERAIDPDPLPHLELAESVGAGADPLDQEVEPARRPAARLRRQRGPAAGRGAGRAAPSEPRRPACRTGPVGARDLPRRATRRPGSRPRSGSRSPRTAVDPVAQSSALSRRPPPPDAETGPDPSLIPFRSRESRGGGVVCGSPGGSGPRRSPSDAAIARTAAEAPVIVVTQGMPWRTAALRIS